MIKMFYDKYSLKDLHKMKVCQKCVGCQREINGVLGTPDVNKISWHSNINWSIEKEWCPVFLEIEKG